jgi:hypothetical protein
MNLEAVISLLIALLLIAVREGLVLKDKLDGKDSPFESKWWHRLGGWSRGFIVLAIFLLVQEKYWYKDWQLYVWTAAAVIDAWPWYNIAINLINGWKLWYLSDNGIDKWIKKVFNFFNRLFNSLFRKRK